MKITDEMEAAYLFYENTLDCEERAGLWVGVSIFMSKAATKRVHEFSRYYDLDGLFYSATKDDNYRFGTLENFTEWYKWHKYLPRPSKFLLEMNEPRVGTWPVIEENLFISEALFLAEEYQRIGTDTTIKRMEDRYK